MSKQSVIFQIYDKDGEEIIQTLKDIDFNDVPAVVSSKIKEIFEKYDYSNGFTVSLYMAR